MRRFIGLIVAFALVLTAWGNWVNSAALAAEPHNSELWHIATINDPTNKKFTYCAAESSFDNGFSLAFARNRELNTNVVVTFPRPALEEHTKFRMSLVIDGAAPRDFVGFSANPQTLVIPLQHDRPIVDSLQKGKLLELRGPKDSIKFALDGANDALRRLQLCVETNLKAEAAGAGGTPEARPLVLGGPAAVDEAPKGDLVEPLPLPGAPAVELAQADQAKPVIQQPSPTHPAPSPTPPAQPGQTQIKLPLDAVPQQKAVQDAGTGQAQQAQLDTQRQAADDAAAKEALARLEAAEAAKKAAAEQAAQDAAAQQKAAQDAQAAETAKRAAAQQKVEQDTQVAAAKAQATKEEAAQAQQAQLDTQRQAADEAAAKEALARLDAAEAEKKAAAEQAARDAADQQAAAQQKAAQDAALAEAARKAAAEQAAAKAMQQSIPPQPTAHASALVPAVRQTSLASLLQGAGVQANAVKGHAGAYSWKNGTIAGSASEIPARQPFLDAMLDSIDTLEKACKGQFSSSIGAPTTRAGTTYAEVATKCGPLPAVRLYYEKAGNFGVIAQESAEIDRDNAVTIRQRFESGLTQATNNQ